MKKNSHGNSFIEVIVVLLFVGILTAIAVPRFSFSAVFKKKADTTARKLVTDLRRTRRLAISDAAGNQAGYELKMTGSSPYGSYEINNLDTSATIDTHTIDDNIDCTGGATFQFGPLGNLLGSSDTQVQLSSNGKIFTITVIPATGMIKCVEN
jgi:Tfp pilus assembly protein PilE